MKKNKERQIYLLFFVCFFLFSTFLISNVFVQAKEQGEEPQLLVYNELSKKTYLIIWNEKQKEKWKRLPIFEKEHLVFSMKKSRMEKEQVKKEIEKYINENIQQKEKNVESLSFFSQEKDDSVIEVTDHLQEIGVTIVEVKGKENKKWIEALTQEGNLIVKDQRIFSLGEKKRESVQQQSFASYSTKKERIGEHIRQLGVTSLWKEGVTGKGVRVAIVDGGLEKYHPDFLDENGESPIKKGIALEYDYLGFPLDTPCPPNMEAVNPPGNGRYTINVCVDKSYQDYGGHGTHVTGIIGARKNGTGIIGVAPDVELYIVKILDGWGEGRVSNLFSAFEWVIEEKIDVVNMSFGYQDSRMNDALQEVIHRINEKGIILVAGVGNDFEIEKEEGGCGNDLNEDCILYPAKFDGVVSVGSVDYKGNRSVFSSVGKKIDFVAFGEEVESVWIERDYRKDTGTSVASPQIAGIFALLKQKYPNENNQQLFERLKEKTKDLGNPGKDREYGWGRVVLGEHVEDPSYEVPNEVIKEKPDEEKQKTEQGPVQPTPHPENTPPEKEKVFIRWVKSESDLVLWEPVVPGKFSYPEKARIKKGQIYAFQRQDRDKLYFSFGKQELPVDKIHMEPVSFNEKEVPGEAWISLQTVNRAIVYDIQRKQVLGSIAPKESIWAKKKEKDGFLFVFLGRQAWISSKDVKEMWTNQPWVVPVQQTDAYVMTKGKMKKIGVVYPGTHYRWIRSTKDWHEIQFADQTVYISKYEAKPVQNKPQMEVTTKNKAKIQLKQAMTLYVKESGKWKPYLSIEKGNVVPYVQKTNEGYIVSMGKRKGYLLFRSPK
ncbi:S8 family peptidase [Anoxybacillus ayderensis]|uniref:S8 family peptidase n=1 Tax=Anoxybacillus ayderensis TaxID=265546 RepID=UPI000A26E6ED|nr:S8 family peptidase [Anoxybacillus ayderensis]OSX53230.1 hypothetical protein B7H16_12695 [Anoxybacillus ayderensis]